ncbi:alpha-ketoacid dehydrogenase subunit beta [Euzebya tangerina]|uniref:alpha-ketoacid dehydrogenase subunit beta n=1 Tax=Euzebya tangerina TaxID=591198 RepID=UPI000E311E81|nr:alpha-ketoacid dehydrogenase subunit beta [Euzebya tangerina]
MTRTTYAKALAEAFRVALAEDERVFMAGEDIGIYGGAFGVTDGLLDEFGPKRILDTPISEEVIAGLAVGAAIVGQRPIVEMQFSDFIVNAMDPIVNQAAKLHFMYGGQVSVPMIIRGPGGGGTGAAAQHSQSLEAWFAHVPGLKVVTPATAQDVHDLLLASLLDPDPVVFLEHKLLYKVEEDVEFRSSIADTPAQLGQALVRREGGDCSIVAYSIMVPRALEAAEVLAEEGIDVEVVDLRTLRPMDTTTIRSSVKKTGRLVTAQEAPVPVSIGAEVAACVAGSDALDYLLAPIQRVGSLDVPMPYAKTLETATIPQTGDIVDAARRVMKD